MHVRASTRWSSASRRVTSRWVAALGEAEAAEALGDYKAAVDIYEDSCRIEGHRQRGRPVASGPGEPRSRRQEEAADAYLRVYYEFPLTDAPSPRTRSSTLCGDQVTRTVGKPDIGRAQILYGARRYPEARAAFAAIQGRRSGDDRELVDLRIAECDYFLKRYAAARDGVQPYLDSASRKAEARFFYLSALRELGKTMSSSPPRARSSTNSPTARWSEEALNNLGTYYILTNEDELAAQTFRELYEKFPTGRAPNARRGSTAGGPVQDRGLRRDGSCVRKRRGGVPALRLPAAVPLLGGARARQAGERVTAAADRLRIVYADYVQFVLRPARHAAAGVARGTRRAAEAVPANRADARCGTCRRFRPTRAHSPAARRGLYDDALNELRFAQRAWGPSRRRSKRRSPGSTTGKGSCAAPSR